VLGAVPWVHTHVKSQSRSPLQIIKNRHTLFCSFFLFRNCILASVLDLESLGAGYIAGYLEGPRPLLPHQEQWDPETPLTMHLIYLHTFGGIESFGHSTGAGHVCRVPTLRLAMPCHVLQFGNAMPCLAVWQCHAMSCSLAMPCHVLQFTPIECLPIECLPIECLPVSNVPVVEGRAERVVAERVVVERAQRGVHLQLIKELCSSNSSKSSAPRTHQKSSRPLTDESGESDESDERG